MGLIRLLLALGVLISHSTRILNFSPISGRYAVMCFYVISGFYITMILREKYKKLPVWMFYRSRFFRLWPSYLFAAIIGLISIVLTNNLHNFFSILNVVPIWQKIYFIFSNIFILGQDVFWFLEYNYISSMFEIKIGSLAPQLSLITPAFSLSIEMYFYILAPFIVCLRPLILFPLVAVFFIMHRMFSGWGTTDTTYWQWAYHFFPSCLIYFSVGIISYEIYLFVKKIGPSTKLGFLATILLFIITIAPSFYMLPNYVNIILFGLLVPWVFYYTKKNKLDRFLGDLCYPVYLIHFPIIQILDYQGLKGEVKAVVSLLITLLLSSLMVFLIDRPINKIRERQLKKGKTSITDLEKNKNLSEASSKT